ncbi:MAG: hypothetical protein ABJF23_14805 [Bryobacteraceae bacterium]
MPLSSSRLSLMSVCWLLTLLGCGSHEVATRMPEQRWLPATVDPPPFGNFLDFATNDGLDYIVRDIDGGGVARWTRDHPELQFNVAYKPSLHLVVEFIIVGETFRATGPVTISVKVNNHLLGSMRCTHEGEYRFDKPVGAELITRDGPTRVIMEANPVWVSPSDGAHLAYLLLRAGFR